MKKGNKILTGTSLLTAISASLCCITPVLALISGSSGLASSFSWLEPARPYLLGTTAIVLAFAWFQKLKSIPVDDCGCEVETKPPFMQTKTFLGIVTVFAIVMMAFPYYSGIFYGNSNSGKEVIIVQSDNVAESTFEIEGMTCQGCEEHIKHAINQLEGVIEVNSSYDNGNAIVKYDKSIVTIQNIQSAIDSTSYTTKSVK